MKTQIARLQRVYMNLCVLFVVVNFVADFVIFFLMKGYGLSSESVSSHVFVHEGVTSLINLLILICGYICMNRFKWNEKAENYVPIMTLVALTTVSGAVHSTFPMLMILFLIPIFLSTVFGDRELCSTTLLFSLFGETIVLLFRWYESMRSGKDDILFIPEACLAYIILAACGIVALIMLDRFQEIHTAELKEMERLKTQNMNMQMVTTLVNTIEAKDPYTNGHSNRVAMYAREIAVKAGKDDEYLHRLYYMSILHDIGKIGIPDNILTKRDELTPAELDIIKTHPLVGAEILSDITQMPGIEIGARSHHERYDGTGYPDQLAGEDIPEEARIIAVADAYDAMTSERSYRVAYTQEMVRSEIEKGKGTQFDPKFAEIMLELIDKDPQFLLHGSESDDLLGVIQLRALLGKEDEYAGALQASSAGFEEIYHFLRRYARRNGCEVQLVLITMNSDLSAEETEKQRETWMNSLADLIKKCIRQTDVECRLGFFQYMVILTDTNSINAEIALMRIRNSWEKQENNPGFSISFEVQDICGDGADAL